MQEALWLLPIAVISGFALGYGFRAWLADFWRRALPIPPPDSGPRPELCRHLHVNCPLCGEGQGESVKRRHGKPSVASHYIFRLRRYVRMMLRRYPANIRHTDDYWLREGQGKT